jgi:hypothetical protein
MMMMTTGRILKGRAVDGGVLAMAMTMTTARVRRTHRAVRMELGKGRVQTMARGKEMGKAMEEGKGMGNGKGRGIVKQTRGGDDISHAVALQLQNEMYGVDWDREG